jgi:ribose transport system ATP-binding protein
MEKQTLEIPGKFHKFRQSKTKRKNTVRAVNSFIGKDHSDPQKDVSVVPNLIMNARCMPGAWFLKNARMIPILMDRISRIHLSHPLFNENPRQMAYNCVTMTNSDILVKLCAVSKSFPGVKALKEINLVVRRGETHVLLGENGAGKSTLVKILTGVFPPDSGTIYFQGQPVAFHSPGDSQKAGIGVIYQERNLIQHLTIVENIYLGSEPQIHSGLPIIDQDLMLRSTQALLDRLNLPLDPNARVEELHPAEQQMVEVARTLHQSADLIIMDEPTAALSSQEVADLFNVIRMLHAQGVTILYISHRLEEVLQIGDRATVLRDGRIITTVPLRETSMDELIQWMVGRHLPEKFPKTPPMPGPEVLRVEDLRPSGTQHEVSFSLHAGEILGIAGLLGAGGTALARTIFGADPAESGRIFMDGQPVQIHSPEEAISLGIGLLTEDRLGQGLVLEMKAEHNMTLVALESAWPGPLIDHSRESEIAKHYAELLGIRNTSLSQPALHLSGGTQQKIVLSKWLAAHARVLIFDEPTRGVDIGARIEIYRLMNELARQGTGIIIASVDLSEILGMCDRILVLRRGAVVADLPRANASKQTILKYASGGGSA